MSEPESVRRQPERISRRIPTGSVFYEKIVPILLAILAIGLLAVILLILAALLGVIPTGQHAMGIGRPVATMLLYRVVIG